MSFTLQPDANGILPDRMIAAMADAGLILPAYPFVESQIQPASLDLRLGDIAYRVRASFLPGPGATVAELEHYLLGLPFLPPGLASAIHQLGNPITTLPIPVLPGLGQSQTTTVNGDQAVLLGGDSQLLSAVIWEHQGTVRVVGGLLDPGTVEALARG